MPFDFSESGPGFRPAGLPSARNEATTFDFTETLEETQAFGREIGAGLILGSTESFVGPVVKAVAEFGFGVDDARLAELEEGIQGKGAAQTARFVAEWAPTVASSLTAFGLGRAAATTAIRTLATRQVAAGTAGRTAQLTARALAPVGTAEPVFGGLPAAVRAGQIAGGALATGAEATGEELIRGAEPSDAIRTGLVTLALTALPEAGILGAGRLLGKGRPIDPLVARARFQERGLPAIQAEREAARQELTRFTRQVEAATGAPAQEANLVKAIHRNQLLDTADPEVAAVLAKNAKGVVTTAEMTGPGIAKLKQATNAAQTKLDAIDKFLAETDVLLTSENLITTKSVQALYAQIAKGAFISPEAFAGKFSIPGAKFFARLEQAEIATVLETKGLDATIGALANTAAKGLGIKTPSATKELGRRLIRRKEPAPKAEDVLLDATEAFELEGGAGVENYVRNVLGRSERDAVAVKGAFEELEGIANDIQRRVQAVGGKEAIPLDGSLGVRHFITHTGDHIPEEEMFIRLMRTFDGDEARVHQILEEATRTSPFGTPKKFGTYGTFDYNRALPGTLRAKFRQGMPVNPNPFDATLKSAKAGVRRDHYSKALGPRAELVEQTAQAIRAEGGDSVLFRNIADHLTDTQYYDRFWTNVSRTITSAQIASKLTLAVIPNLTQPVNVAYVLGMRAFLAGARGTISRAKRPDYTQAMVVHHNAIESLARLPQEGIRRNLADQLGQGTLRRTGFSFIERANRIFSIHGGNWYIRDTLAKAGRGRLRGTNAGIARRRMKQLGIDLDAETRAIAELGEDAYYASQRFAQVEKTGLFNAVRRTQFGTGIALEKPQFWNSPVGRIVFQFKNFAFNQAKLFRDSIFTEAVNGNLKPLAYYMAFAPTSGAAIREVRSTITGRPVKKAKPFGPIPRGVMQGVENAVFAGHMGLGVDIWQSLKFGGEVGAALGPTAADAADLAVNIRQGDLEGIGNQFLRQPAVRAGMALVGATVLTSSIISDYLFHAVDNFSENLVSLEDLTADINARKQR